MEADVLGRHGAHQLHGHVHQPEADGAAPDRSRHAPSSRYSGGSSLTTARGSLSSRRPLNEGCRRVPSRVHSLNSTSPTSLGSMNVGFLSRGVCVSKGLSGRSSGFISLRSSSSSLSVKPVPTWPA